LLQPDVALYGPPTRPLLRPLPEAGPAAAAAAFSCCSRSCASDSSCSHAFSLRRNCRDTSLLRLSSSCSCSGRLAGSSGCKQLGCCIMPGAPGACWQSITDAGSMSTCGAHNGPILPLVRLFHQALLILQLMAHVLAAASPNTPPAAAVRCAAAPVCARLARALAALPSPQDEMTALLHQGALHLQMPVAQAAHAELS
jgi:hypothetical protein